jgi:putative ABC transport system substrate-binding protein
MRVTRIGDSASVAGRNASERRASTIREVEAAFERVAQLRVDAMLVMADALFFNRAAQLIVLAARSALPTLYFRREFAAAGGLMSYGSNVEDSYRVLGLYAGRILKGEKPGDLPIQLPTKFELVINLATARALRIDIPSALLARADEVIE